MSKGKRRVGAGGRIGGSSSNSVDNDDGFGLGADYDYDDNTQNSQNADSETTNQGTGVTNTGAATDTGAATEAGAATDGGAATDAGTGTDNGAATDTGAATDNAGAETSNTGAAIYAGPAAYVFPIYQTSGLIIEQVLRPDVCERTATTGTILTVRYNGTLWGAYGPQFYSWVDNNEALRFQLGVGQVCGIDIVNFSLYPSTMIFQS